MRELERERRGAAAAPGRERGAAAAPPRLVVTRGRGADPPRAGRGPDAEADRGVSARDARTPRSARRLRSGHGRRRAPRRRRGLQISRRCALVLSPRGYFADGSRRRRGRDDDLSEETCWRRGRDVELRSRPAFASGTKISATAPLARPRMSALERGRRLRTSVRTRVVDPVAHERRSAPGLRRRRSAMLGRAATRAASRARLCGN